MNPFFIFLFFCTFIAIIYWFKNASKQQGITALKATLIIVGLILVILVITGRLPLVLGALMLMLALFKKFALRQLLIPLIKIMSGQYINKKFNTRKADMDNHKALKLLALDDNPSRKQIVEAHRNKVRELQNISPIDNSQIELLDLAREFLIEHVDDETQSR